MKGGYEWVGPVRVQLSGLEQAQFDGLGSNSIARGMDDDGTKRRRPGFLRAFQSGDDVQNVNKARGGLAGTQHFNNSTPRDLP